METGENIYLTSGIVRFSFYIKFKEKIKAFILHFDFKSRIIQICKRGKAIKTIEFQLLLGPDINDTLDCFLTIKTNEPKQYDIYTFSNYERLEILYYLSLISKDPLNCVCNSSNILMYQTHLQKKGKVKWSSRYMEVYNNQFMLFKHRNSAYPTNVISLSELSMKIFDRTGIIIKSSYRVFYFKFEKEETRDLIYNKLISIGIQNSRNSTIERKKSFTLNSINSLALHFFPSDFKTLHSIFQYPGVDLKQIHLENSQNQHLFNNNNLISENLEIDNYYNNKLKQIKNNSKRNKRLMSRKSVQELIKKYNSVGVNNFNETNENDSFVDENEKLNHELPFEEDEVGEVYNTNHNDLIAIEEIEEENEQNNLNNNNFNNLNNNNSEFFKTINNDSEPNIIITDNTDINNNNNSTREFNESKIIETIDTNSLSDSSKISNFENIINRIDKLNSSCDDILHFLQENKSKITLEILNNIKTILENNYPTSPPTDSLTNSNSSFTSGYSTSSSLDLSSLSLSSSSCSSNNNNSNEEEVELNEKPSEEYSNSEIIDMNTIINQNSNHQNNNRFTLSPRPPPSRKQQNSTNSPQPSERVKSIRSAQFIDFRRFSRDLINVKYN